MHVRQVEIFIERWRKSGAAERANYQLFLSELCDLLEVDRPNPSVPVESENSYVFDKAIPFNHGDGSSSTLWIDLYKRGCFVLEAKQGTQNEVQQALLSKVAKQRQKAAKKGHGKRGTRAWDAAMLSAKGQGEQYIRNLPAAEGRPPFLVVVDVGHSIELFAEFTCTGGAYLPFPDSRSRTIIIEDLRDDSVRQTLRLLWTEPLKLDPSLRSAKVTRGIAEQLAQLAVSLESDGHDSQTVASFLMRCIFTMFAEDVGLLPENCFTKMLFGLKDDPDKFPHMVGELWQKMSTGGFSTALCEKVRYFNGGVFEDSEALPLNQDQLLLVIEAAKANWSEVEPAIFGTLLERALDPRERHKLGAHFTPRAYVERLVLPTVVEPLRQEWDSVQAAALTLERLGKEAEASKTISTFHSRLCEVKVLDCACGSGNFLYVSLEHLKRLEGEVLEALEAFEGKQSLMEIRGVTVDPHQLLGIEINPRAASIADMVLWIGTLQWHFRTRGSVMPPEPVIKNFKNIECREAVLAWENREKVLDNQDNEVTRWDARTTKTDPVTGEEVPDESARIPLFTYNNCSQASWPQADFIVGNPPFLGNKRMRQILGSGYCEALRSAYPEVPESVDYVMYWWYRAAELVRKGKLWSFGLITTNGIVQTFNSRVVKKQMESKPPLSITFAIPDHPWIDSTDGAQVRIAMTVGVAKEGKSGGLLLKVVDEKAKYDGENDLELTVEQAFINSDLTTGVDVSEAQRLKANAALAHQGVSPIGEGFKLTSQEVEQLGFDTSQLPPVIKKYRAGMDVVKARVDQYIIDFHGLSENDAKKNYPSLYQRVYDKVRPMRLENNEPSRKKNWWLFGRSNEKLRGALEGVTRYIATCRTAKHRVFVFLQSDVLPDTRVVAVTLQESYFLGVLSSRPHLVWSTRFGGALGVGNDPNYTHTDCFGTFPFPQLDEQQKKTIGDIADEIEKVRQTAMKKNEDISLTVIYDLLNKVRGKQALSDDERTVYQDALLGLLAKLHDELDVAVMEAYGWDTHLNHEEVLERIALLNLERYEEEKAGQIHWIRPEFQAKGQLSTGKKYEQLSAIMDVEDSKEKKQPWPSSLAEQAISLRGTLLTQKKPWSIEELSRKYHRARKDKVAELMETLVSLGQARILEDGRFLAS